MAVGNAGPHLDSAADSLCTWLSRDGGRTWADVAPRASIYEFGNSGGIILSARHEADGPTDTISFSADGGEEFFIWGRGWLLWERETLPRKRETRWVEQEKKLTFFPITKNKKQGTASTRSASPKPSTSRTSEWSPTVPRTSLW